MKKITITANLDNLGDDVHGGDVLEQVDTSGAELIDWQFR